MTWQSPALAWARSIADRHTARTVGAPRLDLVLLRPPPGPELHASYVTQWEQVRFTPRLAITVHTHLERGPTGAAAASSLVDMVRARTNRIIPPGGRVEPVVPGVRPGPERLYPRAGGPDPDAAPEVARRTAAPTGPFERVDRVVRSGAVADPEPAVAVARPSPTRPAGYPVEREPSWPPAAAGARGAHRGPGEAPVIDIEHVTDQVVRAIDRRALAYRERRGRI